jgi:hypothetical protein
MKIEDKIKKIKPYLKSIRYEGNVSMVDVKFKGNWKVPNSKIIGVSEYPKNPNNYIFYSENENIGVDDIIEYIDEVVKVNIEREQKLELLAVKKSELAKFFNNHTVEELQYMKFMIDIPEEEIKLPDEEEDIDLNLQPREFVEEEVEVKEPVVEDGSTEEIEGTIEEQ